MISLRARAFGVAAAIVVAAGTVVFSAGAAGASTCPTVAPGTGTVTPAPAPEAKWSGCDLAGADLSGADLTFAGLEKTDLQGANLTDADLQGTNLTFAELQGADLADADLQNSAISDSYFSDTDLSAVVMDGILDVVGVVSGGITGTPASLPDTTTLIDGYLVGPNVNLDNADLAGVDLAQVYFQGATFVDADLAGANLSGSSISGDMAGANLGGANLAGAQLGGVSSGGITGTPAELPSGWLLEVGYLIGPDAQVTGADLTGQDLAGADLQWTNFDEANLTDANLAGADLANAGLYSTTLAGTNLADADLAGVSSGSVSGTPDALPQNWTILDGYLLGPQVWLYGEDLAGLDLSGLDIAGADLQDANLTGTNLSGTNAAGAVLTGAYVTDANLAGTNLAGATVNVSQSGGITGNPASLPADWVLRSGWLIGPGVFLGNDNLNGVNLSGTDMAEADISFSTFTGSDLSGIDLADAVIVGADFTSADLAGADLFGAYLSTATWTGATCPDGSGASSHGGSCASALAFRFAGFRMPRPGSTIKVSARRVTVRFKLATTSGTAIPASTSAAIGAAEEVRATLTGPGIKATTAYCTWRSSIRDFGCTITDPRGIKKGKTHVYLITVAEMPQSSFQTAPRLGTAANPERIHFG